MIRNENSNFHKWNKNNTNKEVFMSLLIKNDGEAIFDPPANGEPV
jgi:hypothetical protein